MQLQMLFGQWPVHQGILQIRYPALAKKHVFIFFDGSDQEFPTTKEHEPVRRGQPKEIYLTPNTR